MKLWDSLNDMRLKIKLLRKLRPPSDKDKTITRMVIISFSRDSGGRFFKKFPVVAGSKKRIELTLDFKGIFNFFKIVLLFLGFSLWPPQNVFCQNTGFKYLNNYSPNEYNGLDQNWSILQDKRGIIYVGNQGGLLEFDGVSWRLIPIPNDAVRSMAVNDEGTIYIGGENQIGFLSTDSKGALKYMSLLDHLDKNQKDFSTVWGTHATKDGIYFRTSKFLFRWDPIIQKMKMWEPTYRFNASFVCNGMLYIHQEKVGLMHFTNDSLDILPGGGTFANVKIYMLVSYDTNKLLIGTREKGLYIFDMMKKAKKYYPTGVDDYLKDGLLYHGIRLSSSSTESDNFAMATLQGGLIVIDSNGNLKKMFNKAYGLQDNDVRYVFEDSQGNLWLGLNSGISKIEYSSSFSAYDERSNLPGRVLSVIKHHKNLYVGTNSGLYYFASSGKFAPIQGIPGMCWYLLSIGDSLLVATTTYGVFQVGNKDEININGIRKVINDSSYFLLQSKTESNRIWVGTAHGLVSLYSENKKKRRQWKIENKLKDVTEEIRTIVENEKGNLWLGTLTKGVIKVDFPDKRKIAQPIVTRYYSNDKLPLGRVDVYAAAGHIMFATGKGIYHFDEQNKVFVPDSSLGSEFSIGSKDVSRIAEDKNKNIWFYSNSQSYQSVHQADKPFVLNKLPFPRTTRAQVNAIYPDPQEDIIWFASNEGLIRYDKMVRKNHQKDFSTYIRRLLVNGNPIYNGYKLDNNLSSKQSIHKLHYKDRNIKFKFAAPFFEAEKEIQYQYFLEGYDKNWCPLNSEAQKDYTNIDPGLYTFRVRAKNIYGVLSNEDVFRFKILPPWYRTWWAYLIYGFNVLLLMFLVVKWRSHKLIRDKQKLECTITERTKEIQEKNRQLKDQSDKLKEMDRVKSRFFANIAHEFRTPLTLIMSPAEQMLSELKNKRHKEKLETMLHSSQRLLTLINQLLDLSKIDSGKLELQATDQNIVSFLKGILASFYVLSRKNQLTLELHAGEEEIPLYFDSSKMEEVMHNLLINAFKFTPIGGKITVSVFRDQQKSVAERMKLKRSVKISVQDTGIGISQEQVTHIFDRFFQAKNLNIKSHKGTGIGLSLAKEIIQLHHGTIDVHSQEGEGTEFVIQLPMGHKHLKPNEIVFTSETASNHKNTKEIEMLYMDEDEEYECSGTVKNTAKEKKTEEQEKDVIIVVEDHVDVRRHIRDALKSDYKVVEAGDGKEGIEKAKEIIPDLIVSDIMMPEVDGYELCRVLKKDVSTSHVPVILLTAKASEESLIQGLETGADDYITKPFNTKILLTRIQNLIDLRKQLQLKLQRESLKISPEITMSSLDSQFLKKFNEIIEMNLAEEDFRIDDLCEKLNLARSTLFKKIKALTGETPNQFILSYRLKRGAQLLRENYGNVLDVAMAVGFSSPSYFTKCFKEKFHVLPSTYQAAKSQ